MTTLTDILERYWRQILITSYPPKILKEALDDIEAYYTKRFEAAIGEDEVFMDLPMVDSTDKVSSVKSYTPYMVARNELRAQARKQWQQGETL